MEFLSRLSSAAAGPGVMPAGRSVVCCTSRLSNHIRCNNKFNREATHPSKYSKMVYYDEQYCIVEG